MMEAQNDGRMGSRTRGTGIKAEKEGWTEGREAREGKMDGRGGREGGRN